MSWPATQGRSSWPSGAAESRAADKDSGALPHSGEEIAYNAGRPTQEHLPFPDQPTMKNFRFFSTVLLTCFSAVIPAVAQKAIPACSTTTFAAVRVLPRLEYECPEGVNDYDEKILRSPVRLAALRAVEKQLSGFTDVVWWQATVDELNACEIHAGEGELTDEEQERWRSGDFVFSLFGNQQMRLVLISDPCYQTGYGGSNAFLLYRNNQRVTVTQVLDGYYSRVDNSVDVNFAELNGEHILEVATGNSMPPTMVSYFFAIDGAGRAIPKRIFRNGRRLTNEIRSAMLLSEPKDLHLPNDATELNIIRDGKLAPGFSAYEESDQGRIKANAGRMRRIVYRWNGRFYETARR